jgi:glycosyltransferase involved in cell wall biosynthesis
MNDITVNIIMLTYNQEQFIAQTIESVLVQKTNFNYQLVIGEDCSTDKTRSICESYAMKYSDRIKLLPKLEKNIGFMANYTRTIKNCDGKYIANCDGDDYWIDEYKLQKQVDFLNNNSEYSIVYTGIKRLFLNGDLKEKNNSATKTITNFEDLIFNNYIPSVSVLFKNTQNYENEIPNWFINLPYGDWPTYLWTIKNSGKIYFLNEITAIYRTGIGVSVNMGKISSNFVKGHIIFLKCMEIDKSFSHKKGIILKSISIKKLELMTSLNREKIYFGALKQYLQIIVSNGELYKTTKLYLYSIYRTFKRTNTI